MTGQTKESLWTGALVVVLVASATVLSVSMGLRQSLGLFLDPMVRGTGIAVATFGLTLAIQNLVWGFGQPVMGALADKYGGRFVVLGSAAMFAIGLILMGLGDVVWMVVGGGFLIGLGVAGTSHGVLVGVISRIASPSVRGTAVALLAAAGSLGTFVIAPLTQHLIESWDWHDSLGALAVIAASIGALAIAFRGPQQSTGRPGAPKANAAAAIKEALSHPGYVSMSLAFFACGFQLIFVATHLPKFVSLCGLPPSVSANALALIGIFNAVGTLAIGRLASRFGNRVVLAWIYVLRSVAIAVYFALPVSVESTLVFAAALGFLWLSVIPPVSGLINSLFGPTNFGALFGVMFVNHQIGAFLGAYLGGLSFDITGSYSLAWASLIVVGGVAAMIQFTMDDRPRLASGVPAE